MSVNKSINLTIIESIITFKTILLASSLVGIVIWMSYRASITSHLSVREQKMPFTTLAELADNEHYRFHHMGGLEISL